MRKVAFTGTSAGLTPKQASALRLHFFTAPVGELHHGMCVGADAVAHAMAKRYGWRVVGHPGVDARGEPGGRAPLLGLDEVVPPLPYLKRNRLIVAGATLLLACPKGREVRRSGTWATVRYARKAGVPVKLFLPDGSVLAEPGEVR